MSPSRTPLIRRLRALARRFGREHRGNVAILFALAAPVIIGGAAFGVESSYWYYKDLKLQASADAAAYAAAIEKRAGRSDTQARTVALSQAATNGFDQVNGTLVLNSPPTSGPNQTARAVEVILSEPEQRFFTQLFNNSQVTAKARAVAVFQTAGNACVLALNPSASNAAWFAGTSDATLQGCSVMSNSVAADAVKMQGSARLTADCLISVGGVSTTGGLSMTSCPAPVTQAPPVGDPFANVPAPSTSGVCQSSGSSTLSPGKFCAGLSLNGNVTFQPGVYVISGGDFKINAGAVVNGSGVTFYLTNGARIAFNGNATINFSPPSSGDYKGMVFFGDRTDLGGINVFNGTAASLITGAIYFPSQQVQWLGNFTGQNGCTQVVADTVQLSGNTVFNVDCTAQNMTSLPGVQLIKLAE
jgi:Flp pilus assembly protein TadG